MSGPNDQYPPEYDLEEYTGIQEGQRLLRGVYKVCCQDQTEVPVVWSMHSDDWTHSYPPEEGKGPSVCVEVRVRLDATGVTTHWIWDNDASVMDQEYGEEILFPLEPDVSTQATEWAAWLENLGEQIGKAAEAAWHADTLSCSECEFHYLAGHEPCCQLEEAEGA